MSTGDERRVPVHHPLLEGLSPAQVAAVTSPAAPVAIVAGPGSGKTRVLTRRIAWRVVEEGLDPSHVLVLTFSRRAASELVVRLRRLGLPAGARDGGAVAGTFHAVAWAELNRHRADRGLAPVVVTARPGRLLAPALSSALGREGTPAEMAWLAREMASARLERVTAQHYPDYVHNRRGLLPAEVVAAAWSSYERAKRDRRVLDLDDLLEHSASLLATDQRAADAAHWRHRHLFVDEYQDLNPAHRRLLGLWLGRRSDLCVVGDPDQAIYGFNGALPDLFATLEDDWRGVSVLHLSDNFRSTPEVVAVAAAVRPPRPGAPEGRSTRGPGILPTVTAYADDVAEADGVAAQLLARHTPGRPLSGVAVLARTNARLRTVASALERVGLEWRLRDPRPLADRPAVRQWLAALPPTAPVSDLRDLLSAGPGVDDEGGDEADRHSLDVAALEFAASAPAASMAGFRTWLDATGVTASDTGGHGVELATFHRAKGLEWPAVWVIGIEEGLVPMTSGGRAGLAEEQRLLYVALTRAEDELALSWAGARTGAGGAHVTSRPSRWMGALEEVCTSLAATPEPRSQRARLHALRTTYQPAGDGGRRAALTAWRAQRARMARIPPAAVLADHLVEALAASDVRDEGDVARIAAAAGTRAQRWAPEILRALNGPR